jgi:two-component SAPR family response regulator
METAFDMHVSGYLLKPFSEKKVRDALQHLRHKPFSISHKPVRVQCFGSFEVFQAGKPLRFTRQKCKELFAYLIDRHGAVCSNDMIIGNLWPDESPNETRKSMVRTLVTELAKTLRQAEAEDVLIRMQGGVSVDINRLDCDYYRFLNGDPLALHAFHGEYMTQYSFAEETRAALQLQLPASE